MYKWSVGERFHGFVLIIPGAVFACDFTARHVTRDADHRPVTPG